jgi:hypothetical protein
VVTTFFLDSLALRKLAFWLVETISIMVLYAQRGVWERMV